MEFPADVRNVASDNICCEDDGVPAMFCVHRDERYGPVVCVSVIVIRGGGCTSVEETRWEQRDTERDEPEGSYRQCVDMLLFDSEVLTLGLFRAPETQRRSTAASETVYIGVDACASVASYSETTETVYFYPGGRYPEGSSDEACEDEV